MPIPPGVDRVVLTPEEVDAVAADPAVFSALADVGVSGGAGAC